MLLIETTMAVVEPKARVGILISACRKEGLVFSRATHMFVRSRNSIAVRKVLSNISVVEKSR